MKRNPISLAIRNLHGLVRAVPGNPVLTYFVLGVPFAHLRA